MRELPRLDVPWTEGDVLPEIAGVLYDDNGQPIDLTGQTVRLNLARPTTALQLDATIPDPTNGAFHFEWEDDSLVVGVGQEALIRLINGDGDSMTLARFLIDIGGVPTP